MIGELVDDGGAGGGVLMTLSAFALASAALATSAVFFASSFFASAARSLSSSNPSTPCLSTVVSSFLRDWETRRTPGLCV